MRTKRVYFDVEAAEALRTEFFDWIAPQEYNESLQTLLAVPGRQMYKRFKPPKGGDLYTIRDGGVLVGVLLNKFYAWDTIRSQLNFRPRYKGDRVCWMSLAHFESMLPALRSRQVVGELAYFWVNSSYRGCGIGTQLFDLALSEFRDILKRGEVIFTFAMGRFSGDSTGPKLQKYLLEKERLANGTREDGTVKVTGIEVSARKILTDQKLDVTHLVTRPKSVATEILARKRGFTFRGYSKNLSILYTLS